MSLTNTSSSITEPVTLAEMQAHGRLDVDDAYLTRLITVARRAAENHIGQVIPVQQFTWVTNELTQGMALPVSPLASIVSLSYEDVDGATQTIDAADYQIVTEGMRSRLHHLDSWPELEGGTKNRVTIVMTAGSATTNEDIKQAIVMIALGLYENREDEVVGTIVSKIAQSSKMLLAPYRIYNL